MDRETNNDIELLAIRIDKRMNLVEEKEMIEHLPNDTSPMLRETKELKDIAKIGELARAKVILEFQSSLLN